METLNNVVPVIAVGGESFDLTADNLFDLYYTQRMAEESFAAAMRSAWACKAFAALAEFAALAYAVHDDAKARNNELTKLRVTIRRAVMDKETRTYITPELSKRKLADGAKVVYDNGVWRIVEKVAEISTANNTADMADIEAVLELCRNDAAIRAELLARIKAMK